jgi:CheY-like chemotaxis protein
MTESAKLSILIAEDNLINQRLLVSLLKRLGHSGVISSDGNKAVECVKNFDFDLILMDVMMPHLDGLEAIQIIRDREKIAGGHIPIIIVSAHDEPGEIRRMLQRGADGYIIKPVSIQALSSEISRFY